MTLSISKYSTCSIGERLTIDDATITQCPLEPVGRELGDSVPSISDRTPSPRRSIFSSYWKTDPRPSHPLYSPSRTSSEAENQQRPQRRQIQKTYTYTYDRDPYQFFGIEEDGSTTSTTCYDGDSDSLNSYESALHNSEVGVMGKNCRSHTCPSLFCAEAGIDGMVLKRAEKTTQSDTILYTKPRLSCLRKSRFSFNSDSNDGTQRTKVKLMRKYQTSVSFESKIKIHLFKPPVEKWAENRWSNWFDHSY